MGKNATSEIPVQPGGIYLHIPFCIKKCGYCDFYSVSDLSLIPDFVRALVTEAGLTSGLTSGPGSGLTLGPDEFDAIYFGGGTPSLLEPDSVESILQTLFRHFTIRADVEITLEANPKTITLSRLRQYRNAGINRLHIGVQSFRNDHLRFLNRVHSGSEAQKSILQARQAGFDNLGIDLIYGLPGQTPALWQKDLEEAIAFAPEHLSCYMLSYEPGTVLDQDLKKGIFKPLSDSRTAALFTATRRFLKKHGYFPYEISNFARVDAGLKGIDATRKYRSRHNQKYWNFAPYLGFGPSAHSYDGTARYWNVRDVRKYISCLDMGTLPVEDKEVLTRRQRIIEAISLGFRKAEGIDIPAFNRTFGLSFPEIFRNALAILTKNRLIIVSPSSCRLSARGLLLLNGIAELMIDDLDSDLF